MKMKTLQRQIEIVTPKNRGQIVHNKKSTAQTFRDEPKLKTKIYSFQDLSTESLDEFCARVHQINALVNIGKKITDPNVLMLNSTQKEMVQMIIDNNKHSLDQKSKFLTQRAGKYIKLLWKTQKFNDSIIQNTKIQKTSPHYATPIHNFKKTKAETNKSLSPLVTNRSQKQISKKKIHKIGFNKKQQIQNIQSKPKRNLSEDQKFSNIYLHKHESKRKKDRQKSIDVDLTKNIAWKTINTTKNFDNMLKILKKQAAN